MKRVPLAVLRSICRSILVAAGTEDQIASVVTESLVAADMKGVRSHGVIRLRPYIESIRKKTLIPNSRPKIIVDRGPIVVLDGNQGFGQFVAITAMDLAIDRARQSGLVCVGARHLHHSGMLEFITSRAAEADMIGIAYNNTEPLMAPIGGKEKVLGNNPFSISVPTMSHPVTLDMALSVVARGKIRQALFEGRTIEEGWAVDKNGVPTTEPSEAMDGSLLPMSGHKGFGIAFMVDIFAGILTGSATGQDVITWEVEEGGLWTSGLMTMVINPAYFLDISQFKERVSQTVVRAKKAQGENRIFVPGEDRMEMYTESEKDGIPISDELKEDLTKLGRELGINEEFEI